MSFAQRVATLHPLLVSGAYIAAIGLTFAAGFSHIPLLLILAGWPLCLYVAARNATTPAPVHRFPLFAKIMFGVAIAGSAANALLALGVLPASDLSMAVRGVVGAAFAIGVWASFFLAADALIKADTRQPWVADVGSTWGTAILIAILPLGIWLLHHRIQRAVAAA